MKRFESAFILAGGQSRRFGENKALVSVSGEPLIVRLANQLASEGHTVTLVVQKRSDYSAYPIPSIEDGVENSGPLAGVRAALRASSLRGDAWCLISSCDILDWRTEWLTLLETAVDSNSTASAVIFSTEEPGDFRPFPGLYRSTLLGLADQLWGEGGRSMREWHRRIEIQGKLEKCRIARDLLPKSFNTQSEFQEILQAESRRGGG